jgi:hypothetical protein
LSPSHHILAEKHGGKTTTDNLALSCTLCNRRKGSDISSVDPETGEVVPLFNPRTQRWSDHFRVEGVRFVGRTPEGRTTVEFLRMNSFERLVERDVMIRAGVFPLD